MALRSTPMCLAESRSMDYQHLKTNAQQHFALWSQRLRLLRRFYFQVADAKTAEAEVVDLTLSESFQWQELGISMALSDALPISWNAQLSSSEVQLKYAMEFVCALFDVVFHMESSADSFAPVSFVEIAIWCMPEINLPFPFWNTSTLRWDLKPYSAVLLKPTLAALIQVIRFVFGKGLQILGLEHHILKGIRKPEAGLILPADGLACCTNSTMLRSLASRCFSAAGQTKLRKASDLAPPAWDLRDLGGGCTASLLCTTATESRPRYPTVYIMEKQKMFQTTNQSLSLSLSFIIETSIYVVPLLW